jgi:dTDP-4-amino-4,6-dideoxygalactose transaminase
VYEREHPPGFRWLHESFGTNWRMTEMQAPIGRIQLKRMKDWTDARAAHALAIREAMLPFAGEDGVVRVPEMRCSDCRRRRWTVASATPPRSDGDAASDFIASDEVARRSIQVEHCTCQHAYYKFYAYVRPENLTAGWSRDHIVEEINSRGVPCYTGSCSEVYLEKAFEGTGFRPADRLPVAKELGETSLMFLVHPTLKDVEIRKTQDVVTEVLTMASIS